MQKASYNPRKISEKAAEGLKSSLEAFGDIAGIVVNTRSGNIVCGHQRTTQLEKLGATFDGSAWVLGKERWPVRFVDWDDRTEKRANIAANERSIQGEFDQELLDALLAELGDSTGELEGELEKAKKEYGEPKPHKVAEDARVQPCDTWHLGDHVLTCTDSMQHVFSERPTLILTDPPYNVGAKMKKGTRGPTGGRVSALETTEWDQAFDMTSFLQHMELYAPSDGSIYIFTSDVLLPSIYQHFSDDKKTLCAWCKTNPMPSMMKRGWVSSMEHVVMVTRGKHVFNYPEQGHALAHWVIPNDKNEYHPTQKPFAVIEHPMLHSSRRGDLVIDPFLGSGTTLLVAEKHGRRCHGVEMNPKYCDVIIERWETMTGKKAVKA